MAIDGVQTYVYRQEMVARGWERNLIMVGNGGQWAKSTDKESEASTSTRDAINRRDKEGIGWVHRVLEEDGK